MEDFNFDCVLMLGSDSDDEIGKQEYLNMLKEDIMEHPLFQSCISAIDRTHVRVVLLRDEQ